MLEHALSAAQGQFCDIKNHRQLSPVVFLSIFHAVIYIKRHCFSNQMRAFRPIFPPNRKENLRARVAYRRCGLCLIDSFIPDAGIVFQKQNKTYRARITHRRCELSPFDSFIPDAGIVFQKQNKTHRARIAHRRCELSPFDSFIPDAGSLPNIKEKSPNANCDQTQPGGR